jgi:hypothetical protein
MSALSSVIQRGTRASQPAAASVSIGTLYCVTDEGNIVERSNGATWDAFSPSGAGTVTNTGTLTANAVILGNGGVDVTPLGSLGTTTTLLHGNAAGAPTFAAVSLTADVSGTLPVANGGSGATTLTGILKGNGVGAFTAATDGTDYLSPATGVTRLAQVVTTGSQATVDFTSISGAYSSLKVEWTAKNTLAGSSEASLRCKVNNDGTAGNYTVTSRSGSFNGTAFDTTSAASAAGWDVGILPNAGDASVPGNGELVIAGYAATTFHKRFLATGGTDGTADNASGAVWVYSGRWKSTAAITRLTFSTDGTAFVDGSIFTLYGIP